MKKASPTFRVLAVVLLLASLGMIFLPWMSPGKDYAFLGGLSCYELVKSFWEATKELMKDGFDLSKSTTADILAGTVMVLLAVTALLGLVLAAFGLRWGGIPYAAAGLLFAVLFYFYYLRNFNTMLLQYYGISPFRIGIGLVLFPLLAIAAALCLLLPKKAAVPAEA